jgi:hypothetical protein
MLAELNIAVKVTGHPQHTLHGIFEDHDLTSHVIMLVNDCLVA